MSPKELITRFLHEVWNERREATIFELIAPRLDGASEGGPVFSPEEFRDGHWRPFLSVLPDFHVTVDAVVGEGELTAVRWTAEGTHQGEFYGARPTGARVRFQGMTWMRFRNGQLVAGEDHFNLYGLVNCLASGQPSHTVEAL